MTSRRKSDGAKPPLRSDRSESPFSGDNTKVNSQMQSQEHLEFARRHIGDAFSSSSEDESESHFLVSSKPSHLRNPYPTSEFDKALMAGVPSTGAASFEGNDFGAQTTVSSDLVTISVQQQVDNEEQKRASRRQARVRTESGTKSSSQMSAPPVHNNSSMKSHVSDGTSVRSTTSTSAPKSQQQTQQQEDDLAQGVLPDVLMTMRQKIESLTLFDSDMMKLAEADQYDNQVSKETRDSLKRSSQQSLSAAVLVSLAHKRYERRRLAAMEIEKVIRSLVQQNELDRVKAILLLLSDDYVRSTSEDARKGGVVALAACGIGLKKAKEETHPKVLECRDLILASVVHACQDHSQRVRYYATESMFNVVKVIPTLAVQHFFILFEILRSLYADVDVDVRSGAELLDKKLKEVIVGAINSGSFSADSCVPIFARFVYIRNKATKRLTLTWLQELNEKLIGTPVLEFLHLFLSGIFAMIADPNISIRQSALAFLQSVLPKLLNDNEAFDDDGVKVDFDKLIQSLVTTLEHPDPFVRKVAMYWMCRIAKTYMGESTNGNETKPNPASMSVRNSLPHVLPGILLSIGDTFHTKASTKDSFLPDQTTHSLAEQTNFCLQQAVRRDGRAYASHLDGFLVALREELDSPGHAQPTAVERKQYRMDVTADGTGIESTGWFRASKDTNGEKQITKSRLCALEWITVLYESVVPDVLKAEFAREFISPIIHQLVDNPPEIVIFKSLEVLANITVPVNGERKYGRSRSNPSLSSLSSGQPAKDDDKDVLEDTSERPMTNSDIVYALEILGRNRRQSKSRDREVFSAIIQLHASNHQLLADLARVIQFMCTLQPPEFVFVSFAVELDNFVRKSLLVNGISGVTDEEGSDALMQSKNSQALSADLNFVSSFVQQMSHVLLSTEEAKDLRDLLKDCIGRRSEAERDKRRTKLFHILLYSFSHNLVASVSLSLWAGAFKSASTFLQRIDPLDIDLEFLLELDQMVELLERPLFRHFHLRMLQSDLHEGGEGSGTMLVRTLKLLLMIVPQSACYKILRDRIVTVSRFRQSALVRPQKTNDVKSSEQDPWIFASRVLDVRKLHCDVRWQAIRSESLETVETPTSHVEGSDRLQWLGYSDQEEELKDKIRLLEESENLSAGLTTNGTKDDYHHLDQITGESKNFTPNKNGEEPDVEWKAYWTENKQQS